MIKYLFTPTVRRRWKLCKFLSAAQLTGQQGFQSVYGYTVTTVDLIQERRHLRDLYTEEVYSDILFVDFDNNLPAAQVFGRLLLEHDYTYELYTSGNRSWHYHVKLLEMSGSWVPGAQKIWAQANAAGCDTTIYRHDGLFRIAGTWHEKRPGRRKELVASHVGQSLHIPQVRWTPPKREFGEDEALEKLERMRRLPRAEGERRCFVWYLGALAASAGLDEQEAIRVATEWNHTHATPPLNPDTVERKIEEAYIQKLASR